MFGRQDGDGTVDLSRVLAAVAAVCEGPHEDRAAAAFQVLQWGQGKFSSSGLPRAAVLAFMQDLHHVYMPKTVRV